MLISRLIRQANKKWFNVQKKTTAGVQSAREAFFQAGIIAVSAVIVFWLAIFLYTVFYYAYMPSMSYVRPVHLEFKSCNVQKGICSFPSAYVQLTKKQQLLMVGQPYKVNLHLEMPESPANRELGMFMVCAQLKSRDEFLVKRSCRSAMLHYRSTLLHTLSTLTFSPMMIFGTTEEKQNVVLELFSNFEEDQSHPVTKVYVEIQSRHIEFYSATLMINAHLSGLRYLMFHWPVLSAVIGVGTNLFFIALVCILSYLRFAADEEHTDESFSYEKCEADDDHERKSVSEMSSDNSSEIIQDFPLDEDVARSEEKSQLISDILTSQPSYVQELSSLIGESSASELNK